MLLLLQDVGGRARNIVIQLVLPQCCKTSYTFFVARFSVPLRSDDGNENVIKAIGLISKTTTSFARASHLFVHFFAVTARP